MEHERKAKLKSVIRVTSGNLLEMYDFMVFGYYAEAIGRTFFPRTSTFASLMAALATFGAGFLMRPPRCWLWPVGWSKAFRLVWNWVASRYTWPRLHRLGTRVSKSAGSPLASNVRLCWQLC